jgi:7-keto-8-aminopelargonate synthetase-like enzyme
VDPKTIDVLMGTFTKSFASVGGYISGSHALIAFLKHNAASYVHATLSFPAIAQIRAALQSLSTPAGVARLQALAFNTRYFRDGLDQIGVEVTG